MGEWNLAETTLGLTKDAHYEVGVLPIAATEAHGPHLPYATDTIQVTAIAEEACRQADAEGARVLLLPTIPFGINENTLAFKWTVSLRPSTLFRVVSDIVSCLEHHGILKLLLLNGHGGNEFQPHLRELFRQTRVQVLLANWYGAAREAGEEIFEEPGEHADEMESSMMLHLRPELVHMEAAGSGETREPAFTALREGWGWIARPWGRFTLDSSFGDPRKASAEKGERYMRAVVEKLKGLIVEMSEKPIDDLYPYCR